MSCRHYCIEFLKKSFSKTFLFLKIIYKYFAGFLACINNSHSPRLLSAFGEASRRERGGKRSNLFSGLLHYIRNDGICCNDNDFQFDKFQRLFSVIYKKFITKGDLNYVKSKNNF